MKIVWNERSIRWFHQAADYTCYNKELARILIERIPHKGTLLDVGCGAALVDFELAPYFDHITCVDISQCVIDSVNRTADERGLKNIDAICMDGDNLTESFDTVIALYHGGSNFFERYFHLAKENLILVTHRDHRGKFGPEGYKVRRCFNAETTKEHLDRIQVRYTMEEMALEHGQPFTDYDDAVEFVRAYSNPMSDEVRQEYMDRSLLKIDHPVYSYYLPGEKQFAIFTIRRKDNENV